MKVQIDVFGSYVARDAVRYMDPALYELNRCIGGVPVSTLFEPEFSLPEEKLEGVRASQYDKRMLMLQLSRKVPALLKKSESKFLVLDLAAECMNRLVLGNESHTAVAYPEEMEDCIQSVFSYLGTPVAQKSLLDLDSKVLNKKYRQFVQNLVKSQANPMGYEESNIIVIEAYCTENYIANRDGQFHPHNAKYKVKEVNEILKTLYELLYRYMPTCRVIKLPDFTHSTENHLRGPGPLSYTEDTYLYLARCIEVYCGVNKQNSVENLYGEQSLQNKLETRVARLYTICNIGALKKEIAQLTVQVSELEEQVQSLMKKNELKK